MLAESWAIFGQDCCQWIFR